jgi:hypothetical protein
MKAKSKASDIVTATAVMGTSNQDRVGLGGVFTVTCFDADGNQKWVEDFHNLVVNVGLKFINDTVFSGSSYTAAWYIGLVNDPATYDATDTMTSHAGWTENTSYSQSARPTLSFGSASNADPSIITASAAVFSMNSSGTIAGAFVSTDNTKGGTGGTLLSAGDFVGIARPFTSGDTLNVTYSFSADAA